MKKEMEGAKKEMEGVKKEMDKMKSEVKQFKEKSEIAEGMIEENRKTINNLTYTERGKGRNRPNRIALGYRLEKASKGK